MPQLDPYSNPTIKMTVSPAGLLKNLHAIRLTKAQMLTIEKPGAAVVMNVQRTKVPVDTGATKESIQQHIIEAGKDEIVDDIGPETYWSFWIEFGNSYPNYPVQPFVRPSADESNIPAIEKAMAVPFGEIVEGQWEK